jgi:hypothetical protein
MSEQPDPSWSAERMVRYMEEKYGPNSKYTDAKTGRRLTWAEVVKLWDSAEPKNDNNT